MFFSTWGRVTSDADLIGAGQPQPVEDRDEDMSRDEQAQEVGAAQEPVLSPKGVHLRGSPQDGHGRLEGGEQGQGHGQAAHGAVRHQELLNTNRKLQYTAAPTDPEDPHPTQPTWVVR